MSSDEPPKAPPLPPLAYATARGFDSGERLPHSRCGLVAIILAGVSLIVGIATAVWVKYSNSGGEYPGLAETIIGLGVMWSVNALGVLFAILGLCLPRRRKVLAGWGLICNLLIAVSPIAILAGASLAN